MSLKEREVRAAADAVTVHGRDRGLLELPQVQAPAT